MSRPGRLALKLPDYTVNRMPAWRFKNGCVECLCRPNLGLDWTRIVRACVNKIQKLRADSFARWTVEQIVCFTWIVDHVIELTCVLELNCRKHTRFGLLEVAFSRESSSRQPYKKWKFKETA